jgi:perosamine synthetase
MSNPSGPKIPLSRPIFDREMENAALEALRNEHFVMGESTYKFEEEFARYCGVNHCVSTSSGTAALHLCLIALGIKKLDQVITTPFSFVATANAIVHAGATPVFADIKIESYNIDPNQMSKVITRNTKAIIPVHLYGYPSQMKEIMDVAKSREISILEDACQAHGAEYQGLKVGSIGDAGCFSFYSSKNMTVCGDGGMVTTSNEGIAKAVAKLRDCGRKSKYIHDVIGYTARLNTVNSAIGRVQLRKLDRWNEQRRKNARLYNRLLVDLEEITLPPGENSRLKPVYHLYVIRTKKRDALQKWLQKSGIVCGVHYPLPINLQPVYKKLFKFKTGAYPQSELASRTCLSIPMYPDLTNDDIRYVSEKIHEFFNKRE